MGGIGGGVSVGSEVTIAKLCGGEDIDKSTDIRISNNFAIVILL